LKCWQKHYVLSIAYCTTFLVENSNGIH
jgi:hypothetical protein